ncbi:hypothetical protein MUP59_01800 [Candidatus Bathyarchaeota archaeon]|nr:hypothetical protein [Candidatus Bathyarchaeota archaeon]
MPISAIIKKLDEIDLEIRAEIKSQGATLGEMSALEEARELVQQALTPLLRYQL